MTRKTAAQLGITLHKNPFKPCVACGMGKSKQKNVPKSHEEEAEPGVDEQFHADISIIRKKVQVGDQEKSYVVPTGFCWSMLRLV